MHNSSNKNLDRILCNRNDDDNHTTACVSRILSQAINFSCHNQNQIIKDDKWPILNNAKKETNEREKNIQEIGKENNSIMWIGL